MDAPSVSKGDHRVTEGGELIPEGTDGLVVGEGDRKSVDDKSGKEESISDGDQRVTVEVELIPDIEGTDGLIVGEEDRKSVDDKSGKEECISEGDHRVTVGVVLIPDTEGANCLIVGEDRKSLDYKSGNEEERRSFSFDQVITLEDNIQTIHPGFLQTLIETISNGYNGTLLIGGNPRTGKDGFQIDHDIIKQVLTSLFGHISSVVKGELLSTVSCVQFYPDNTAVDVLNSGRQALKPVFHPILGCVAGGLCEASVCSAEEAFLLYEKGTQTMRDNAGILFSRCTSLFSVGVEWRIDGEEADSEFYHHVRLQMFSLAGGASKTDLRGVSPLVKVLDHIQSGAKTSDKLLPFLLMDALNGNSKTVFLCCIQPQGVLDEVPSGLDLAQRVRGFVTKTNHTRWCPRSTETEIRKNISELRREMSQGVEGGVQNNNTHRLAELISNLQIVKDQSWEKRRDKAEKIKDRIMGCTAPPPGDHSTDNRETSDRMKYLEEQLRREMQDHIREGKGSVEKVQARVARIQQLREALREEMSKHDFATEKSDLSQQSQSEYSKAKERRRQMKKDHEKLIQEEVDRMENELTHEQVEEGPQRELVVLTKERRVLVLQMEALGSDGLQAEKDLEDQYRRHQEELHCLRQESLQVFRVFRQVSEEQRRLSEGRYRAVLLEAVQDAVYLSAQNQQLQADNKHLRTALGELKDALAVQGDHKAELLSQQQ